MTYRTDVDVVESSDPHAREHIHERVVRNENPLRTVERLIIFLFGLIELLIVLRIVLLLFAARESNDLVAAIYNVSEIFVAPFRGILRIDEVQAGATALDIGALVALVGWIVIELVVLGLVRVFRPTATA
jgi:uncharacterized protein YggT (Ycf19 family)